MIFCRNWNSLWIFYKAQQLNAIHRSTFTNKHLQRCMWNDPLTVFNALSVVSSREAARHPSSVEPPSHIPANAAMLLHTHTHKCINSYTQATWLECMHQHMALFWPKTELRLFLIWKYECRVMRAHLAARRYMSRSQSLTPGIQTSSSFSVTWPPGEGKGCSSGSLAY